MLHSTTFSCITSYETARTIHIILIVIGLVGKVEHGSLITAKTFCIHNSGNCVMCKSIPLYYLPFQLRRVGVACQKNYIELPLQADILTAIRFNTNIL